MVGSTAGRVSYARRGDPEAMTWLWVFAFVFVSLEAVLGLTAWDTQTPYTPMVGTWPVLVVLVPLYWRVRPRDCWLSEDTFGAPSGPVTMRVPLTDIVAVRCAKGPVPSGLGSALPAPQLTIRWRGSDLFISPQRPWQVLHGLEARCPHLVLDGAGLRLRDPVDLGAPQRGEAVAQPA